MNKLIKIILLMSTLIMATPIEVRADAHIPHETDMIVDAEDLKLMSCLIWHEAENQCEAGKQAVGIIVMNRLEDDSEDWGDTVEEVIYKPGQFTNAEGKAMKKAAERYDKGELPNEYINAAVFALNGNKIVNYNNNEIDMSGYLYFGRNLSNKKLTIQDHDFK